jgi:ABC-2 type transport system permease protein
MWSIAKKEWQQFFSSVTGYMAIIVFLLICGLLLFVFPDTSIVDFGYATLDKFFDIAPLILLILVPTITMRSMAEEFKAGTFEILRTKPLTGRQMVWGKFWGCLWVVLAALLPTFIYIFSVQALSVRGGIDVGGTIGSYIGLIFLSAVYTAIGICASSFTNNSVVAFILAAFACLAIYYGFTAFSKLPVFSGGTDYYAQTLGIQFHYKSMSRGVVDSRDLIYFIGAVFLFLLITERNILNRK